MSTAVDETGGAGTTEAPTGERSRGTVTEWEVTADEDDRNGSEVRSVPGPAPPYTGTLLRRQPPTIQTHPPPALPLQPYRSFGQSGLGVIRTGDRRWWPANGTHLLVPGPTGRRVGLYPVTPESETDTGHGSRPGRVSPGVSVAVVGGLVPVEGTPRTRSRSSWTQGRRYRRTLRSLIVCETVLRPSPTPPPRSPRVRPLGRPLRETVDCLPPGPEPRTVVGVSCSVKVPSRRGRFTFGRTGRTPEVVGATRVPDKGRHRPVETWRERGRGNQEGWGALGHHQGSGGSRPVTPSLSDSVNEFRCVCLGPQCTPDSGSNPRLGVRDFL